ncbi:Imidazoleglycerol-phosphate dehydratase [Candidatus Lokiarchaeum ossiferum]|uniref:Imidazoleglycerol-phosphate dehydratase n=1 Tax=Candidatus Lokiarchaeum ossiferum TaxID=2951803 RepID=A0ABY6HTF2_9ARCH|nr:Imidazoleglycerol-phosphate dehydratase [Candidatus Lokiarchaeum sp. B-35]
MRTTKLTRNTNETQIDISINLDGTGIYDVKTPIGFLTHMLESFAKHGLFDLELNSMGDLEVDQHHLVEDVGIALGEAFDQVLGDKKGINRNGFCIYPMDDSLVTVALDLGGRPYFSFLGEFRRRYCGELDLDLLEDFFRGFSSALKINLFIEINQGTNDHHKVEAIFKALAKSLMQACSINSRIKNIIPSTKGVI